MTYVSGIFNSHLKKRVAGDKSWKDWDWVKLKNVSYQTWLSSAAYAIKEAIVKATWVWEEIAETM